MADFLQWKHLFDRPTESKYCGWLYQRSKDSLHQVFEDPCIVKVFHDFLEDGAALKAQF
jgi:hypothetical protein